MTDHAELLRRLEEAAADCVVDDAGATAVLFRQAAAAIIAQAIEIKRLQGLAGQRNDALKERDRLVGEREDSRLLRDLAHEEADFLRAERDTLRAEHDRLRELVIRARPVVRQYAKDDLYVAILNAVDDEDDEDDAALSITEAPG